MDRGIANVTGSGTGYAVARCVGVALAVAAAAALWNGSASAQVLAMTSERSVGSIGPEASSNRPSGRRATLMFRLGCGGRLSSIRAAKRQAR